MEISDYPNAIATLERQILNLSQTIRNLQSEITDAIAEADHVIAFDTSLKNEAQRKSKKAEMLAVDSQYYSNLCQVQALIDERSLLEIDLTCHRNHFSVLKLATREFIVRHEATVWATRQI